jgi:hypothetical protein
MNWTTDYQKSKLLWLLEQECMPFEWKDAPAAIEGDVEAAENLSFALENSMRGLVAVGMWRAKVPVAAYRAFLSSVWEHDHDEVIAAAANKQQLRHMFRYAAFPLPSDLPDVVTVWRGTSGQPFKEARKTGYSWTTDRDMACWFAMRFADNYGYPLVLTANVSKSDIVLFSNERCESEAVIFRTPKSQHVDADISDWAECSHRKEKEIKIINAAILKDI